MQIKVLLVPFGYEVSSVIPNGKPIIFKGLQNKALLKHKIVADSNEFHYS